MHQNPLKNGKLFLILLNDGWMVDLAMGSFGFLTIFLIYWHPWDPWICIRSVCWKSNLKQIEAIPPSVVCMVDIFSPLCFDESSCPSIQVFLWLVNLGGTLVWLIPKDLDILFTQKSRPSYSIIIECQSHFISVTQEAIVSFIPYFWFLVFWSLKLRDFLSIFFCFAHLALQNVKKDYVIFS